MPSTLNGLTIQFKNARQEKRNRLLAAASAGALMIASTPGVGVYGGRARAQALPAGCADPVTTGSPNDNDGIADNGETITCLAPAPTTIGGITTTVDDLTLVIGDSATPTSVNNPSGDGIALNGIGDQRLTVVEGSSVYGDYRGVYARGFGGNTTGITVESSGTIEGFMTGVEVVNTGVGNVDVDVVDVSGRTGISASSLSQATDLNITSSGTVRGSLGYGISARNEGTGSVLIDVQNVYADREAVRLRTAEPSTDASVIVRGTASSAFTLFSGAVDVSHRGSGALSVSVLNAIGDDVGIRARSDFGSGMTIVSTGYADGSVNGIYGNNAGYGALTINANDATGGVRGIRAFMELSGTDLSVVVAGKATGISSNGVDARSYGTGFLSVTTLNTIGGFDGIYADNFYTGTDLTIVSTGYSTGGNNGISARNDGSGALTITANDATGGQNGVRAIKSRNGTDLSVTVTGTATGTNNDGVNADNYGTGALSITALNAIGGDDGLDGDNSVNGTDLTIVSTGYATGGDNGITGNNAGSGALTITANDATGGEDGVRAINSPYGTDLSVTGNGTATGTGNDGVNADNYGSGGLSITALNAIGGDDGLDGDNSSNGTDLSIVSTGYATGGDNGITGNNQGSGALTITANDATGGTIGVRALNSSNGTDLSVTATGTVTGESLDGINAVNIGKGALSITALNATGGDDGLDGDNSANGTDLTIVSTGYATGGDNGITGNNAGSGALTITANDATGGDDGIRAINSSNGTDLVVSATGVVAGGHFGFGILAENRGAGATLIEATTVTSGIREAISVDGYGTNISIDVAGPVEGPVRVRNRGTGLTSVNLQSLSAERPGSGSFFAGVSVQNYSGAEAGISVTSADTISADAIFGLSVRNGGDGDLNINVNDVSGGLFGVYGRNLGSANQTNLQFASTGTISAGATSLRLVNVAAGDTSVSVYNVLGQGPYGNGLVIFNGNSAANLTLSASGDVSGAEFGAYVINDGSGVSNMIVNSVEADDFGNAIIVLNGEATRGLSVTTTGTISAGENGIYAINSGSGPTSIVVGGAVSGASGDGIFVSSVNGASVDINDGGSVTGGDAAIEFTGPNITNDSLSLASGGSIVGDVTMGGGNDIFNDASGQFTNVFGGDGTDMVNFTGPVRTLTGSGALGDSLQGFEVFNFNAGGVTLAGTHTGLNAVNINAGATTLTGRLEASDISIASGAELIARDGSSIVGNLANFGQLVIGDSPGTLVVDGDFIQGGSGVLPIEVDGDNTDQLIVNGDVALGGALDVTFLTGPSVGSSSQTIIDGNGSLTGQFASISFAGFGNGLLVSNDVVIDESSADVVLTTSVSTASSIASLDANEAFVGDNLVNQLSGADSELRGFAFAVGSIEDETQLAGALNDLQPEILDLGLKFVASSHSLFIDRVMDQSGYGLGDVSVVETNGGKLWGAVQGFGLDQDGDGSFADFDGEAYEFFAGISEIGDGPVRFGFAGGFTDFTGNSGSEFNGFSIGDRSSGKFYHLAASVRADLNTGAGLNSHFDGVLSLVEGDQDATMRIADPLTGAPTIQAGEVDFSRLEATARFSIDGRDGQRWPLRPFVQLGIDGYRMDGVALRGDGPTSLDIDSFKNTRTEIGVGASADYEFTGNSGVYGRLTGFQYFGDRQNVFSSRFENATSEERFTTFGRGIERQLRLDAAAYFNHGSGFAFDVGFFGEVGDLTIYGVRAGASIRF